MSQQMAERVAVLGTGIMGAPMARNLLKAGFQVRVWNRTPDKARMLAAEGRRLNCARASLSIRTSRTGGYRAQRGTFTRGWEGWYLNPEVRNRISAPHRRLRPYQRGGCPARRDTPAVSRENIEIVRASFEAFFRSEDPDHSVDFWHADGEWRPAMAGAVEQRVYRGRDDIRLYRKELFNSFSEVDVEDRDLGDRVLVLYRLHVRGRDSDLEIDQPAGAVYELRDGKIVRARSYLTRREALEAAGV
jgi:ketosteroid isomerase-like protein